MLIQTTSLFFLFFLSKLYTHQVGLPATDTATSKSSAYSWTRGTIWAWTGHVRRLLDVISWYTQLRTKEQNSSADLRNIHIEQKHSRIEFNSEVKCLESYSHSHTKYCNGFLSHILKNPTTITTWSKWH